MSDALAAGELLRTVMMRLEQIFPDCAIGLMVKPFSDRPGGQPDDAVNWICNGPLDGMRALMSEVIARWNATDKPIGSP